MKPSGLPIFLISFLLLSLFQRPAFAYKKSYLVYFGGHSHGSQLTDVDLDRITNSHYQFLGSFLGSNEKAKDAIFYSYTRNINGFAAVLDEEQAAEIAKHPEVVSIFPNNAKKLHTTRSWNFLGLERNGVVPTGSIWNKARFGEDTIIGNLDTGVWPESESFSDNGYGPIPSKWKGICQDYIKGGVSCNRKLIGARYFNKGYLASLGSPRNDTFDTTRDTDGHGTHTLSTAGGNFVSGASVFGFGNVTAKGGSPKSRVAAYKVCWPAGSEGGCFDADIMAAFDAAIHDGVDVLSASLGGNPTDYFNDGISIGSFHAVKNGITVVCSAGNSGPFDFTVSNVAPWILTVGASTMDREFTTYIALGNKKHIKGQSLSPKSLPVQKFYPLINGAEAKAANALALNAQRCLNGSLDPKKVKDKIVVCVRGGGARVDKGAEAAKAGAVGMILANDLLSGNELLADAHALPSSHITYADSLLVFAYINSTKSPKAYLTRARTELNTKPAPFMASFSSKGPNSITPEILKPDITAPGVSVIAAYTQAEGSTLFFSESGTSMSCPHISGIAGLLQTLYPNWSPAAVRSAIMTTARTRDNMMAPMLNSSFLKATPFSYGAGHVRPNGAMDPGLVYDLTVNDYLNFLCALGYNSAQLRLFSDGPYKCPKSGSLMDFNYPSITVPNLNGSVTVTRTLKNVGTPGTYTAQLRAPRGISVSVEPKSLKFEKIGEEKTYKLSLKANRAGVARDYVFGSLVWSDGHHSVKSPIVVKTA